MQNAIILIIELHQVFLWMAYPSLSLNIGMKFQLMLAQPFWVCSFLSSLGLGNRANPFLISPYIQPESYHTSLASCQWVLLLLKLFCRGNQTEVHPRAAFDIEKKVVSFGRHEDLQKIFLISSCHFNISKMTVLLPGCKNGKNPK